VNRAKLEPQGFFRRIPLLPHQMRDRHTRVEDAIVLAHLGIPRLDPKTWSLTIDGLVAGPRTLRFDDLMRYPQATMTSVHQCAGSPLQPAEPTRRVCNITWSGARLADILTDCAPAAEAKFVWSYGADHGAFGGVTVDAYLKDLPIERVGSDVLVAYAMNGAALPVEHGFPARLVVPGFYGTNSVKWLSHMTLADSRAAGPFTTRWYNDPVLDAQGRTAGATTPVWSIAPESLIVAPAPDAFLAAATEHEVWGWAWADGGVGRVDITVDAGATWLPAQLEPARGREWQRFCLRWTPHNRGAALLAACAETHDGMRQPATGRRNAIHRVAVTVT
jgi:DMSO/TMAO reductase YedYZ molybdopterin-dependent catalytic subunit